MANARIERMLKELHTEPSLQFFQGFFELRPTTPAVPTEPAIPVSLLKLEPAA